MLSESSEYLLELCCLLQFRCFRLPNEKNVNYRCPCGKLTGEKIKNHIAYPHCNTYVGQRIHSFLLGTHCSGLRGPIHLPSLMEQLESAGSRPQREAILKDWLDFIGIDYKENPDECIVKYSKRNFKMGAVSKMCFVQIS